MTVNSKLSDDGSQLNLAVHGRFDFNTHKDFRDAYESIPKKPNSYFVDMIDTSYLDSSALGMLLLLRDYAGGDSSKITIINCSPEVKKTLKISNFDKLFDISDR